MKTLTTILLILSINVIGQTQRKITYSQTHQFANNVSGVYDVYVDYDSTIYAVGDTIILYTKGGYIKYDRADKVDTVKVLGDDTGEAYCKIKSIRVVGNKRRGYMAKFTLESYDMTYLFLDSNRECLYEGRVIFIFKYKV